MDSLGGAEFAPRSTYLNTSSCGVLPRRTVDAVRRLVEENGDGRPGGAGDFATIDASRASFARLVGVAEERVAAGGSVAVHVALIAGSLPSGSEVLFPEREFSSVVTPFTVRGDLKVRYAPLDALADAVRPGTALVGLSAVQSADGRVADLAAVRAAATAHGARVLVDASQSAGWLPLDAGAYDFTVTGAFKYLLCPRGTSFLTVTEEAQESLAPAHGGWCGAEEAQESLAPAHGGWCGAEDRWGSTYGPVQRFATSARRYDEPPSFLAYHGAEQSLALLEQIGIATVHAHNTALAARFRAGLTELGHAPVPGDSGIVAVPGLGGRQPELARAGVVVSARAGNLRVSFHLYNSDADVDRALDVLSG
ncbi:aminotransferase class V-fold PLP-dependent enzyme [Streptomyces sp. FIT100]|uniref:aminotransferase class V-fold PLP-dependent enzyme n=1 Tax=Streptomyces sp. FIT100 TaxID=2837956 RepID=UPI0021C6EA11|nr:aminotransferase class V-fold PLP-dependent enzyme [Streptomyces sp. FIT100]UUN26182.1 aminotransferase class V-fold PLP-dependent enzyme [Streptomyces sp. FIT100]